MSAAAIQTVSLPAAPLSVVRLHRYLEGVFKHGLRWYHLDFDAIARRTGMSRRTLERAVAWIRTHWPVRFSIRTRRIGRVFAVQISDRQTRPLSPTPPIPAVSFRKDRNTAGRLSALTARLTAKGCNALRRLAAFVARRELEPLHWDNCKVAYRFAHAYRFALSALLLGHERQRIAHAYRIALHRRHGDATDYGLNRDCAVSVRWEPSSTVSLAASLLADGRTDGERIAARLESLAPAKAESARILAASRAALESP